MFMNDNIISYSAIYGVTTIYYFTPFPELSQLYCLLHSVYIQQMLLFSSRQLCHSERM